MILRSLLVACCLLLVLGVVHADTKRNGTAKADLSRFIRGPARISVSNPKNTGGTGEVDFTLSGGPALVNVESITLQFLDGQYSIEPGWQLPNGWQAESIGGSSRKLRLKSSGLPSGGPLRLRVKRVEPGPADDWMTSRKIDLILKNKLTIEQQETRGVEMGLYDLDARLTVKYRDGREETQDLILESR